MTMAVDLALSQAKEAPVVPRRLVTKTFMLLLPPLVFLGIFFGYPMADIFLRSIHAPEGGLSLVNYMTMIERPAYMRVTLITLELSLTVTVLCVIIGYPLAYVAANSSKSVAGVMMGFVLLPFLTSVLVRNYGWMVMLRPGGIVADTVSWLVGSEVPMIYNRVGVLIGLVYTMLPYLVLTLFSVLKTIDSRLVHVAHSLGASRWSAFRRIYLPLSLPGVVGGALLVFILSSGFYITPRLMGGDRDQMLSSIVAYQVEILLNWNFASALAVVLLAITLICFLVYARVVGIKQLVTSKW